MNQIYKRNEYIIFRSGKGYIAYNTKADFEHHHTHLSSYGACKRAIHHAIKKTIPRQCSFYFLESIRRLSNNKKFRREIENLILVKQSKGKQRYYNVQRGENKCKK